MAVTTISNSSELCPYREKRVGWMCIFLSSTSFPVYLLAFTSLHHLKNTLNTYMGLISYPSFKVIAYFSASVSAAKQNFPT